MLYKKSCFNPKIDTVRITLKRVQIKTIHYLGQLLNKQAVDNEPVQERATYAMNSKGNCQSLKGCMTSRTGLSSTTATTVAQNIN